MVKSRWSFSQGTKTVRPVPHSPPTESPSSLEYVSFPRHYLLVKDRPGAGTDANVFMTAYGNQGDSGKNKLDNAQDNFERNKTDIFTFEWPELGELSKIRIGHDNKGFGASWFLDKVTITNLSVFSKF